MDRSAGRETPSRISEGPACFPNWASAAVGARASTRKRGETASRMHLHYTRHTPQAPSNPSTPISSGRAPFTSFVYSHLFHRSIDTPQHPQAGARLLGPSERIRASLGHRPHLTREARLAGTRRPTLLTSPDPHSHAAARGAPPGVRLFGLGLPHPQRCVPRACAAAGLGWIEMIARGVSDRSPAGRRSIRRSEAACPLTTPTHRPIPTHTGGAGAGPRSTQSSRVQMGRDWITDAWPKIPDEQLKFVHEYLDTKGKNVVRGPARIPGPDGRVIDVLADQEVRAWIVWLEGGRAMVMCGGNRDASNISSRSPRYHKNRRPPQKLRWRSSGASCTVRS